MSRRSRVGALRERDCRTGSGVGRAARSNASRHRTAVSLYAPSDWSNYDIERGAMRKDFDFRRRCKAVTRRGRSAPAVGRHRAVGKHGSPGTHGTRSIRAHIGAQPGRGAACDEAPAPLVGVRAEAEVRAGGISWRWVGGNDLVVCRRKILPSDLSEHDVAVIGELRRDAAVSHILVRPLDNSSTLRQLLSA